MDYRLECVLILNIGLAAAESRSPLVVPTYYTHTNLTEKDVLSIPSPRHP